MNRFLYPLSLAVAVVVLAIPVTASAQREKQVTITAKLTGSAASISGLRVLVLPTRGSSVTVTPRGGKITAKIAASALNGTSLQLLQKDGAYAGPVLLNRTGSTGATRLAGSTASTIALGTIRVSKGFGALVTPLPTTMTLAKGRVKVAKSGAPVGAGRLGLVKTRGAAKATRQGDGQGGGGGQGGGVSGAPGGACTSSSASDAGPGGDCDRDGVPNTVDVDDNGNLTLDAVDAVSAQVSARINPWSALRPALQNATNVYAGTTRDQINAALGSTASVDTGMTASLQLVFYLDQRYIDPLGSTAFDNLWIGCPPQMTWCATGETTARIGGFSEAPSILPTVGAYGTLPWGTYTGSECRKGQPCEATNGPGGNALVEFYGDGGGNVPTWVAFVNPNAPDTLGSVVPGDVVTLNAQRAGVRTQVPISISPYFVTSPAVQSANTTTFTYPLTGASPGANQSTAITLGADGLLTLRLWRPQRFALPGETGEYYDIAGLHWGATYDFLNAPDGSQQRPSQEAGCPLSRPVGLSAQPYSSAGSRDRFNTIVPLVDDTKADFLTDPTNAANATIGYTIDVGACVRNAGNTAPAGSIASITVQGVGEAMTGGANRTSITIYVKFP
jgi:hypothetical protein